MSVGIICPNLGLRRQTSKSELITVYSMCSQWENIDMFREQLLSFCKDT